MKTPITKLLSLAASAALTFAGADAVADEGVLPPGSCIYSGDTNRTCTASVHLKKDVDFAANAWAWVDDLPLDAFAYLTALQTLQRFRSNDPSGLRLIVR